MKLEIAQRWVKALRSGKYKQGKMALKYTDRGITRHCCLGVLCELYQQDKKQKQQRCLKTTEIKPQQANIFLSVSSNGKAVKFADDAAELPASVAAWAGLQTTDGTFFNRVKGFRGIRNLASLNDKGATFKQIANVIEERLEEL